MSSSVDVIAPLREQGTTVNLSVLQQKDRAVQSVIFTAKHVVLYHLSPTHTWSRQDIEGPLFIVQRSCAPFFQIVILNRKSITDWKQDVSTDMEGKMEINGKSVGHRGRMKPTTKRSSGETPMLSELVGFFSLCRFLSADIFNFRAAIWL